MKISREDLLIVFVALLIGGCIYFGITSYSNKQALNDYKEMHAKVTQEKLVELAKQKKGLENSVIKHEEEANKSLRVIGALEKQLKQNRIYYANKIKSLSAVNTYSARQKYADSLANLR